MTIQNLKLLQAKQKEILFTEQDHSYKYKKRNAKYSVTQFIKLFFHEFNTHEIIDRMMRSKNWANSKYYGMNKQDIEEVWEENRDIESSLGTQMHKNFEKYLNGESHEENAELFALQRFIKENPWFEWQVSELSIFDDEHLIAGSIDVIAKHKFQDYFMIIDFKRSKEIKYKSFEFAKEPISHIQDTNYWHYALQLNLYKYFLEKNGIKIGKLALLHIDPKHFEYKLIDILDMQDDIKKMLDYAKNNSLPLK